MKLAVCPACKHMVSKQSMKCPQCGHPIRQGSSLAVGCLTLIVVTAAAVWAAKWLTNRPSENGAYIPTYQQKGQK